jgi:N-acyl-D-amino-acid deacylase
VMHLVQQGKISLEEHAIAELNLPPVLVNGASVDPRLAKITVLNLLQHRGGFDRKISPDPEFQTILIAHLCGAEPPATAEQTIRVMEGRPLDFDPGSRYAYSPFGYCVLGRVIERATGEKYEKYVQREILAPLGIGDMRIGHSLLKDKLPHEVTYYTPDDQMDRSAFDPSEKLVPAPYGSISIEAHDANGGWVATAVDLVRFASAFDEPTACPVLSAQTIHLMYSPPPGFTVSKTVGANSGSKWYGCGWNVNQVSASRVNVSHEGALEGNCAVMVRRWDGTDYVILFTENGTKPGQNLIEKIQPKFEAVRAGIRNWPYGKSRGQSWP